MKNKIGLSNEENKGYLPVFWQVNIFTPSPCHIKNTCSSGFFEGPFHIGFESAVVFRDHVHNHDIGPAVIVDVGGVIAHAVVGDMAGGGVNALTRSGGGNAVAQHRLKKEEGEVENLLKEADAIKTGVRKDEGKLERTEARTDQDGQQISLDDGSGRLQPIPSQ